MMQNMIKRTNNLKQQIHNNIEHSYLQQYIVLPNIDEEKLMLVIELTDSLELSSLEKEKLMLTTSLIQLALDTHEEITNEPLTGVDFKKRQLSILAGVYYSGLYYKLLADIDDTIFTRQLAIGIKEVNEHKITLYQSTEKTVEQLFEDLMIIESALIDKISQNVSEHWFELSRNFLLLKRLIKEKELLLTTGSSPLFKSLYFIKTGSNLPKSLDNEEEQMLFKIFNHKMDSVKHNVTVYLDNITDVSLEMKECILSKIV